MLTAEDERRIALLFRDEIAEVCEKSEFANDTDECIFLMAKGANFTAEMLGSSLSDIDKETIRKLNQATHDILTSKTKNAIGNLKYNQLASIYGL